MKNLLRTTVLVVLLGLLTAVGPAPVQAADPGPNLPACTSPTQLNCTATLINQIRGGHYCQQLNGLIRCELFWPFRNPTANAAAALDDRDAFPADYVETKERVVRLERRVDQLGMRLDRKNERIAILRKRLDRLRD